MTLIVQTTARALVPAMLLCSAVVFARGHHLPGGGFSGGLLAVAAFALLLVARGRHDVERTLRFSSRGFLVLGLGLAVASGLLGTFHQAPFLTGLWTSLEFGAISLKLGTPLLFDAGVYFVVLGFGTSLLRLVGDD